MKDLKFFINEAKNENKVLAQQMADTVKNIVLDFYKDLDNIKGTEDYQNAKAKAREIKDKFKSLGEQVSSLVDSYNPGTIKSLVETTLKIVRNLDYNEKDYLSGSNNFSLDFHKYSVAKSFKNWTITLINLPQYFSTFSGDRHVGGIFFYNDGDTFDEDPSPQRIKEYKKLVFKEHPLEFIFKNNETGTKITLSKEKNKEAFVNFYFDLIDALDNNSGSYWTYIKREDFK